MTTFFFEADLARLFGFFDDLFTRHPLFAPVYGRQCTSVKKKIAGFDPMSDARALPR
jgi:hypothetical protein